jgi:hypothetical protein
LENFGGHMHSHSTQQPHLRSKTCKFRLKRLKVDNPRSPLFAKIRQIYPSLCSMAMLLHYTSYFAVSSHITLILYFMFKFLSTISRIRIPKGRIFWTMWCSSGFSPSIEQDSYRDKIILPVIQTYQNWTRISRKRLPNQDLIAMCRIRKSSMFQFSA